MAKAHHSFPCTGAVNICCKDELEREIHPLTLTPAGRKRARVSAGTLRDWPGKEWSVGRAEQTVDAHKTENGIEFGHFRKSSCYWMQVCVPNAQWGQTKTSEFGAEKGLSQGHANHGVCSCPQSPKLAEGFQENIFKGKGEGGALLVDADFLVQESFVLVAVHVGRSGHSVPVNLQQDKCYSLFCNWLYKWKSVVCTLKGQSFENGLSYIFRAIGNILNSKQKQ